MSNPITGTGVPGPNSAASVDSKKVDLSKPASPDELFVTSLAKYEVATGVAAGIAISLILFKCGMVAGLVGACASATGIGALAGAFAVSIGVGAFVLGGLSYLMGGALLHLSATMSGSEKDKKLEEQYWQLNPVLMAYRQLFSEGKSKEIELSTRQEVPNQPKVTEHAIQRELETDTESISSDSSEQKSSIEQSQPVVFQSSSLQRIFNTLIDIERKCPSIKETYETKGKEGVEELIKGEQSSDIQNSMREYVRIKEGLESIRNEQKTRTDNMVEKRSKRAFRSQLMNDVASVWKNPKEESSVQKLLNSPLATMWEIARGKRDKGKIAEECSLQENEVDLIVEELGEAKVDTFEGFLSDKQSVQRLYLKMRSQWN